MPPPVSVDPFEHFTYVKSAIDKFSSKHDPEKPQSRTNQRSVIILQVAEDSSFPLAGGSIFLSGDALPLVALAHHVQKTGLVLHSVPNVHIKSSQSLSCKSPPALFGGKPNPWSEGVT